MAKSKIQIKAEKVEASRAKNLSNQSGLFLAARVGEVFTKLKQVFIEAPILNPLDLEHYIQIETDISSYGICEIFSQLILDDLGQQHPMAIFFQKIILAET